METETILRCEQCGTVLPSGGEQSGCLYCLLRVGLENASADESASPAESGSRFYQHYEILTRPDGSLWELGRGAMGVTYKAIDVNLQMPVTLKVIDRSLSTQPDARRRFLQEAQVAAQLRHPNVASVFHFGVVNALPHSLGAPGAAVDSGDCFYAMEFVEGETLDARLRRSGPLSPQLALQMGLQIARALGAAEQRGLVHRDLNPSNVMLLGNSPDASAPTSEVWVKLIDFGLALFPTQTTQLSQQFLGTPAFASPEHLAGGAVDVRSDIYSLGGLIWYALSGRTPFSRKKDQGKFRRPSLPLTALGRKSVVPLTVARLLRQMLSRDPAARPSSAADVIFALQDCLEKINRDQTAGRLKTQRRFPRPLAFAAIVFASALVALTVYLTIPQSVADKSVAVLPFKNLSDDPRNSFFADGMEDDLLSSLLKIRDLKVVSRLSTSRYLPNLPRNLHAIGRALGVRHVLQGSVRRDGDHVHLNVALVDTQSGKTLWAQDYDRTLADTISLQSDLATAIADALDATLSPQEKVDLTLKPTHNPNAYLLYLRGRKFEHGASASLADYEAAESFYRQALVFDPGFALAHACLAAKLALLYHFRGPSADLRESAQEEARKALRLQPDLGEGHLARGLCLYYIDHDLNRALQEFKIARLRLPNDPEPDSFIAYIHRRQGKWRKAREELERVITREPQKMNYEEELFATACLVRDWPLAEKHIRQTARLAPDLPQVKAEQAYLALWQHGNIDVLRQVCQEKSIYSDPSGEVVWMRWDGGLFDRDFQRAKAALDRFPYETLSSAFGSPFPKSYLEGCIQLAEGDNAGAEELFEIARPSMEAETLAHPDNSLRHARLGLLYAYMGRKADAIREGEKAVQLQPVSSDHYDGPQRLCNLALIHARVGDTGQAIAMVKDLLTQPGCVSLYEASLSLWDLRLRWQWDPLRGDPQFQKILAGPEPKTVY